METRQLVWKTGLFVLIGLVLGTLILFAIGNPRLFQRGYEIDVLMETANGLLVGTPVRYAGVNVGEVRQITLQPREAQDALPPVAVRLWIANDVEVREDDQIRIGILGILGERFVEIVPQGEGAPVQNGAVLVAAPSLNETEMMAQAAGVLGELSITLKAINEIVPDAETVQKFKEEIQSTLAQAGRLLSNLDQMSEYMWGLIEEGRALSRQVGEQLDNAFEWLAGQWQALGDGVSNGYEETKRWAPWVVLGAAALGILIFLL